MNHIIIKLLASVFVFQILMNCGGGSSGGGSTSDVLTGVLVDSPVEGVSFTTLTQSGITNSLGEFTYVSGETVSFSIGQLVFPSVLAAASISPVELSAGSTDLDATTTNIARLLQSLDQDGNPYNGITIPAGAAANSALVDFNVSVLDFENNAEVINLIANSGSTTTTLFTADEANAHLYQVTTLDEFTNSVVGKQAILRGVDGSRDESTQAVINADGTVTGFTPAGSLILDWYWDDQYYCRSGTSAGNEVPLDCQIISVQNGILIFLRNRGTEGFGNASHWFIE